ncbi:hypothetical protein [Rhodobacter sp. 24-YEA-8]|uniref:hypothetical protein n=1 Tax=Rhodobacter sp. 24-YEA-8 TaxID=1884310 RepID=UPI001495672A|nr:hypothetical protein [Rhodobacter sp. 24-YEA-8]
MLDKPRAGCTEIFPSGLVDRQPESSRRRQAAELAFDAVLQIDPTRQPADLRLKDMGCRRGAMRLFLLVLMPEQGGSSARPAPSARPYAPLSEQVFNFRFVAQRAGRNLNLQVMATRIDRSFVGFPAVSMVEIVACRRLASTRSVREENMLKRIKRE